MKILKGKYKVRFRGSGMTEMTIPRIWLEAQGIAVGDTLWLYEDDKHRLIVWKAPLSEAEQQA